MSTTLPLGQSIAPFYLRVFTLFCTFCGVKLRSQYAKGAKRKPL
ncbi:hypothetical protein [Leptolyngbya sp. FACHB-711]|nr:hypothetical protein [Leptolyngbya sp. FACHB-711]